MTATAPFTLRQLAAVLDTLASAEQRVARVLLDAPDDATQRSVTDLARAAATSEATVVRMCKKAGFEGYQDLKIRLVRDLAGASIPDGGEVDPDDGVRIVVRKIFAAATASLAETATLMEPALLLRAVEAVERASEVTLFGVGTSAYVALDAMRRLMRIGIPVNVETSGVDQAVRAALLPPSALVIAVSSGGASRDTVAATRVARDRGATVLAVTHAPNSPLGRLAHVVLPAAARESAFGTEAMAARLTLLTVLDALFVLVAMRRHNTATTNLDRITAALRDTHIQAGAE